MDLLNDRNMPAKGDKTTLCTKILAEGRYRVVTNELQASSISLGNQLVVSLSLNGRLKP
jgi:hypothetical protein